MATPVTHNLHDELSREEHQFRVHLTPLDHMLYFSIGIFHSFSLSYSLQANIVLLHSFTPSSLYNLEMSLLFPRVLLALAVCLGSATAQSSSPGLGGPFDFSTFPQCSVACTPISPELLTKSLQKNCYDSLNGLPGVCDYTQSDCSCSVFLRSFTATCESVNCSPGNFDGNPHLVLNSSYCTPCNARHCRDRDSYRTSLRFSLRCGSTTQRFGVLSGLHRYFIDCSASHA